MWEERSRGWRIVWIVIFYGKSGKTKMKFQFSLLVLTSWIAGKSDEVEVKYGTEMHTSSKNTKEAKKNSIVGG